MTRIISGQYRNRSLNTPKGWNTRPSASRLREALFNICQGEIEGARVLDLFAGSGALGFEALSRGAYHVTFVDHHEHAIQVLKKNVELLGVKDQTRVVRGDAIKWLQKGEGQFDMILVDPPYGKGLGGGSATTSR